jgi:hypothetical protein
MVATRSTRIRRSARLASPAIPWNWCAGQLKCGRVAATAPFAGTALRAGDDRSQGWNSLRSVTDPGCANARSPAVMHGVDRRVVDCRSRRRPGHSVAQLGSKPTRPPVPKRAYPVTVPLHRQCASRRQSTARVRAERHPPRSLPNQTRSFPAATRRRVAGRAT